MLNYVLAESSEVRSVRLPTTYCSRPSSRSENNLPEKLQLASEPSSFFLPIKQTRYNLVIGEL